MLAVPSVVIFYSCITHLNYVELNSLILLQTNVAEHFGVKEFQRQLIQQRNWRQHQNSIYSNNNNNDRIGRERLAGIRRPNICSYNKKMTLLSKASKPIKNLLNLCKKQPEIANAAYLGLAEAAAQCRRQFKFGRWNCTLRPTLKTFGLRANLLHEPAILQKGYKETAFFVALSSAGVAWSVAKACVIGASTDCKCNIEQHASHQNWEWGGCSYSVKYGLTMSRKLLLHARPRNQYSKIYKHNLKAGRLAVKKTLATACKCHGVSGSCQLKTCWKATADMNQIGSYLMRKYRRTGNYFPPNLNDQDDELEEDHFNTIQNLPQSEAVVLSNILPFYDSQAVNNDDHRKVTLDAGKNRRRQSSDLAYYEKSPSFCDLTHGRLCDVRNKTHSTSGGDCVHLCCRRGYIEMVERYEENCDCVFKWCCSVACKKCSRIRYKMICK